MARTESKNPTEFVLTGVRIYCVYTKRKARVENIDRNDECGKENVENNEQTKRTEERGEKLLSHLALNR